MGWFLFMVALAALVMTYQGKTKAEGLAKSRGDSLNDMTQRSSELNSQLSEMRARLSRLSADNESLQVFSEIRDIAAEAARISAAARAQLEQANIEAASIKSMAADEAAEVRSSIRSLNSDAKVKVEALIIDANNRAAKLVADAETRAEEVAGDALRALRDAERLEQAAKAMKNVIEGYGDRYLVPTYSLLDQLADDFGYTEAGQSLKAARANTKSMMTAGRAATCDYVENSRRETAIRFVIAAFNGSVDSILSRTKAENAGTLEQQINDAFALVNNNGAAFKNARITPEYLAARLEELKWGAAAVALREQEKEEQRQIREQMRDEERARREIEKALRDAAKEEDAIQKAMERMQTKINTANDEQRAELEAQLAELQGRLSEAEAKNQRALSMAQQTKAGHVYVISNIGSFGESVVKVGMTRRLEPLDRVRELGDASVPFPFDVHAMIWTDDAPSLEYAMHKRFIGAQVNKVNPRKEFFRISSEELRTYAEEMGINATWTMAASAAQYRETLAIERALAANSIDAKQWLEGQLEAEKQEFHESEDE